VLDGADLSVGGSPEEIIQKSEKSGICSRGKFLGREEGSKGSPKGAVQLEKAISA